MPRVTSSRLGRQTDIDAVLVRVGYVIVCLTGRRCAMDGAYVAAQELLAERRGIDAIAERGRWVTGGAATLRDCSRND